MISCCDAHSDAEGDNTFTIHVRAPASPASADHKPAAATTTASKWAEGHRWGGR